VFKLIFFRNMSEWKITFKVQWHKTNHLNSGCYKPVLPCTTVASLQCVELVIKRPPLWIIHTCHKKSKFIHCLCQITVLHMCRLSAVSLH
jgi:hypothetical protein